LINTSGNPIPLDAPEDLSIMSWLNGSDTTPGHLPPRVDPVVSSVIDELRSTYGVESIGGVGYCFGAKYVVRFLHGSEHQLNAGFIAHPSFVTAEELRSMEGPLSIAAAAKDPVFSVVKRRETEEILSRRDVAWQMCLYSDVDHGFAVRCEAEEPRQKFAMDQAFLQALFWFNEQL
jgi:dienelactone hydrolase